MVKNNLRQTIESEDMQSYLQIWFDAGKSFEFITQQLRIALCSIARKLTARIDTEEPGFAISLLDFDHFYSLTMKHVFNDLFDQMYESGSPGVLIRGLSTSSVLVLGTARKCAHKASVFNFEAVFKTYKDYMLRL